MSKFYSIECPKKLSGDDHARSAVASEPEKLIKFINVFREEGSDAAKPLFPEKWEWFGENWTEDIVFDAVHLLGPSFAVSEKAFQALKTTSNLLNSCFDFEIDGTRFYWISPLMERGSIADFDVSKLGELPSFFMLLDESGEFCNEAFVNAWTQAGLTGAFFTKIRE